MFDTNICEQSVEPSRFRIASSKTARDINRRIVLNLVRNRQPISRAALARASGFQRSTVSAITEQLLRERWVTEGALGHLPRGRKPILLHLNSERAGIIGIDLRPGTTALALADIDSRFLVQESLPTGSQPGRFIQRLGDRLRQMMEAHPNLLYEGIGVSLPGRFDPASRRLVFAPNLGWNNVDLVTPLEKATGLPVLLENAANACALAEFWQGPHAAGARNLVAVTVSEGIGTGLIMNGQLLHGASGLAGEFGHVSISDNGPLCRCGNRGCWEVWASNSAACRFYSEAAQGRASKGAGEGPACIRFNDLLRLAEQKDPKAGEALDRMAHYLGVGLAMLISGLAPDVIVVVGEITGAWNRVGPIVADTIKHRFFTEATTRIVPTAPTEQSRLRGTIALVLQQLFGLVTIV
jgi:predicted NBD/HSP70 family sugar kinase